MSKTVNPEMVVLAREYRDMTQAELARKVFLSQASVAKLEGGLGIVLPDEKVAQIAAALDFPVGFLYLPEERLSFGSSAFFYRKKAQISAADRKRITGVTNLVRIHLKRLLQSVDVQSQRKLPELELEEVEGGASGAARLLRAKWGVADGPIPNLTALVESAGVIVVACDFGTRSMDATSLRLAELPPLILINKDLPGDRWRFTLAHELAHLVLHQSPTETMEDEADEFAGELLIPKEDVRADFARIGRLRLQDLANMKPYWKVSIASLLYQASHHGFIGASESKALWIQLAKLGYRTREPGELAREPTQTHPRLLKYLQEGVGLSLDDIAASVFSTSKEFAALHGLSQSVDRKLQLVK